MTVCLGYARTLLRPLQFFVLYSSPAEEGFREAGDTYKKLKESGYSQEEKRRMRKKGDSAPTGRDGCTSIWLMNKGLFADFIYPRKEIT